MGRFENSLPVKVIVFLVRSMNTYSFLNSQCIVTLT